MTKTNVRNITSPDRLVSLADQARPLEAFRHRLTTEEMRAAERHLQSYRTLCRMAAEADYNMPSVPTPEQARNLAALEHGLQDEERALVAILGEDAAKVTRESLRSVLARATDVPPGEARSLLSSAITAPTVVGREVIAGVFKRSPLLAAIPSAEYLGRGLTGTVNVPKITAYPAVTGQTEGSSFGASADWTLGTTAVTFTKRGAVVDASYELLNDAPDLTLPAVEGSILTGAAIDLEALICSATGGLFTAAVGSTAAASPGSGTLADIVNVAGIVRDAGAGEPTHAAMAPATWTKVTKLVEGTTSAPLVASVARFVEVTGLVPLVSSQAASGEVLVIDLDPVRRPVEFLYRARIELNASREGQTFAADTTRFMVKCRAALALHAATAARRLTSF